MKSVAVLLTNSYETSYGGVGPFVKNLDVHLSTEYNLQYFSLPQSYEKLTWIPHRLIYLFYLLFQLPVLRKFDMILSHSPEGSYVVSLLNLPLAHVFHGNGNPVSKSRFWYGEYFSKVFEYMQAQVKKSSLICYTVGESMPGAKKMVNPIAHDIGVKAQAARSGFIFAGRLENGKRIDEIVRIYSELPGAVREENPLFIAGKGSLKKLLENQVNLLGLNDQVIFLGNLPNHQLIDVISERKIMLMASENEGFPMSIAESLTVGVPVISTAVGDIPSFIIPHKNGELLEKDFEREDYITAIQRVLNHYSTYAEGALESSKVFDAKKIVESLVSDLDGLVSQKKLAAV